jgi:GTPase SAR1 family protein
MYYRGAHVDSEYFRGTHGVFVVYDVSDRETFTAVPRYFSCFVDRA